MKSNASDDDGFDAFVSCAPVSSKPTDDLVTVSPDAKSAGKTNEEEDFFNQKAPEQKRLDKESILKLYESSNPVPNQLFNLAGSTPLQPMNLNGGQFNNHLAGAPANGIPGSQLLNNPLSNSNLFSSAATGNGFANFNQQQPPPVSNQLSQQPPFLAFNQTPVIPNSTIPNTLITQSSTNPFLNAPATNGATPNLPSTDLFSSANLQTFTTLESQLNDLNLQTTATEAISSINWPTNNSVSTGQTLFSANFDNLNSSPPDKKLNGVLPPATSIPAANPFLANTTPLAASNLDILSAFGSTPTNGLNNLNGLNKSNSENWSTLHTPANNGLTSGLADLWQ